MAFAAGDVLTVDRLNGPLTSFTPTWSSSGTAVSLGNGTNVGYYSQVGRWVKFSIVLTMGSTTTFGTGYYSWVLPSTPTGPLIATAVLIDSGTTIYLGVGVQASGSILLNTHNNANAVGQTVPHTWASGDSITIQGEYYV